MGGFAEEIRIPLYQAFARVDFVGGWSAAPLASFLLIKATLQSGVTAGVNPFVNFVI